jgi:hypothetical protein
MKIHAVSILIFALMLSVMAMGRRAPENGGGNGAGGSGMNGDTLDTTQIEGTVETISLRDSMMVVSTTTGEDTIYYTANTEIPQGVAEQVLSQDAQVRVWYVTREERNIAVRWEPGESGDMNGGAGMGGQGAGQNGEDGMDTTELEGTVQTINKQDSLLIVSGDMGEDSIYYDAQTQFPQNKDSVLKQNAEVRIEYVTKNDKKTALSIEQATSNGAGGSKMKKDTATGKNGWGTPER